MTRQQLLALALVAVALGGVATGAATVQSPAQAQMDDAGNQGGFTVGDLSAPAGVTPGEEVQLTATLSNPTDQLRTERVEFRFGGDVVARTTVSLEAGGSTTVTATVNTSDVEPGEYIYAFFAESAGQTGQLTVSESFALDSLDAPSTVTAGEDVTVTATVSNPNDFTTTQPVEFRVAGSLVASQAVTVEGGSSATVTFELPTAGIEPGTYFHGVFTRDGGAFAALTVQTLSEATASVTFDDQLSDGTTVTVGNVTVPDDGYVAIHDDTLLEGNVVGSVIGVSEFLANGTYENLTVTLYDVPGATVNGTELTENRTLIAMPHVESTNDTVYDFVSSNGTDDGPFLVDGQPVTDSAFVTLTAPPEPPVDNGTDGNETLTDGNETPTDGDEPPADGDGTPADGTPADGTPPDGTDGDPGAETPAANETDA